MDNAAAAAAAELLQRSELSEVVALVVSNLMISPSDTSGFAQNMLKNHLA